MQVEISQTSTGLTVLTEPVPGVRSVAVGCWIDTGSRDEHPGEAGAAHFLEHLLFKGTEELSARYISETFDAIGAQSNAFTSKEYTCFWARMLDSELATGMDLLAEMLQRPAFRPEEIDSERNVVIEEINMNEDDPSDVAGETFMRTLFRGHPLGLPVLGTRESIGGMTAADLRGYWQRRYGAGTALVAVAGNVEHRDVVEMVEHRFGAWEAADGTHDLASLRVEPTASVVARDTEQVHLVFGGESMHRTDEGRIVDGVMHHILGGGMSSRLFQKVREERGLAYAVHSFAMRFAETGGWGVYVGTTPANAHTVMEILVEEIERMITDGVTAAELDRAKGHMRGALALSMEDTNTRMIRLGRNQLFGLPHLPLDERLARVEAVTRADIEDIAARNLTGPRVVGAVGPVPAREFEGYLS
ncbi:MAG: insulinase family protein [Acidimicrobiia bacterium]|nr:insulinase family protein [Acidimicrobiia bacterium]MYF84125.1 insulinase family protein [Acidimicrobiia bacterium]